MISKTLPLILLSSCLSFSAAAQTIAKQNTETYMPTAENRMQRKVFQDSKFGIFLHWGIYSMTAQGEWYMNEANIHRDEYAKLASGFYPSRFDAEQWVKAIKEAGARYICFTSRHHDSFSMFNTQESDFNIVKATPFKRDILKELADACHKYGIKLNVYYSHLDWRREDYPIGRTGRGTGRPQGKANWDSYYQFMNNQLTEILTNYGDINGIWFDGVWDQPKDFDWHLEEQYRLIHRLQPDCLIGNNHHAETIPGEDFQMFERDLPGQNKAGYSGGQNISELPLETCETMNGMWGYRIADQNYKSVKELIHLLVKAAGNNANLLLNIGPQPNGELPALALSRLADMGKWLKQYGETIYGTRGGLMKPQPWGVSTQKGNRLFVHILNYNEDSLVIPVQAKIKKVALFENQQKLKFKKVAEGIEVELPQDRNQMDLILELAIK